MRTLFTAAAAAGAGSELTTNLSAPCMMPTTTPYQTNANSPTAMKMTLLMAQAKTAMATAARHPDHTLVA